MSINKFYITLVLVCSIVLALVSIGAKPATTYEITDRSKIIICSHQFHAEIAECVDCHKNAPESSNSNDNLLPKMSMCYSCHDEESTECEKCHPDGAEYVKFDNVPRDIAYTHKYHGTDAEMKCTDCHKGLESVDFANQSKQAMPSMNLCFACHNNGLEKVSVELAGINSKNLAASKNCQICHLDPTKLMPESHFGNNFRRLHGRMANTENFDLVCKDCHTESFCQTCHNGSSLLAVNDIFSDKSSEKSPKVENGVGSKQLITQNVHSLNYIFTHGFEARAKETGCYNCHDKTTFCNDCHRGNINNFRTKPKWHVSNGFTTLYRGSGGGLHATYAKREIETCVSCHDIQGTDPICTMCHVDNDGIKGTNPKTHPKDYGSNYYGNWHNDDGSICFNCHTDIAAKTKRKGVGFCGYCHR